MGYTEITLKLIPAECGEQELRKEISKKLGINDFGFTILNNSLDARDKRCIRSVYKIGVVSPEITGGEPEKQPELTVPFAGTGRKVAVIGSGPAGIFAALVLCRAGLKPVVFERGRRVELRSRDISAFESGGGFRSDSNYAFGEGGAGTFSDGKLTARTKKISAEKAFIIRTYIEAGAPEEIAYLTHPHIGSDNLVRIAGEMRKAVMEAGGEFLFETEVTGIETRDGQVIALETASGEYETDYCIFACGHSAHDSLKLLMSRGVPFRLKNFAIGARVEHPQPLINMAQWGVEHIDGVKAAEYRLTSRSGRLPVYTFCMCPGGKIVPAAAYEQTSVVNGMSFYARNGGFANSACVAGIDPADFLSSPATPEAALDWVSELERSFYNTAAGFQVPCCSIRDFISGRSTGLKPPAGTSYPLGLLPYPLADLFPEPVGKELAAGLSEFCRKLKGFDAGYIMGLESKTSSPVQVVRSAGGNAEGFGNLFVCGEAGGWAGGIVSSAADGIRAALKIAAAEQG